MSRFTELGHYRYEVADLEAQTMHAISDLFAMEEMPPRDAYLRQRIPAFVGMGTRMCVFRLGDEAFVAKLGMATAFDTFTGDIDYPEQQKDMGKIVQALQRGREVPYVEQIRASSLGEPTEVPAVVTRYIGGSMLSDIKHTSDPELITLPARPVAYTDMVDTLCAMEDRGIMPEESASNIICSDGVAPSFNFIDYYCTEETPAVTTAADAALMLAQHFEPTYLNLPLPPAAYLFRNACQARLGRAVARDIEERWRQRARFQHDF